MQVQFEKQSIPCLRDVLRQVQNQEQTQELRVSDGMPDIGSVLGAWGQVILRGKQWQDTQAGISGGVMVWVLYEPEDGGAPCSVESWIPFQFHWDLPRTEQDGNLQVSVLLRGVDARNTSARKFMLRTNVSAMIQGWEPGQGELFTPGALPEDVQVKKAVYPLHIPGEAGEKAFSIEEEIAFAGNPVKPEKLIAYRLQPEIVDKKVMADKAVFRGSALLQLVYLGVDGRFYSQNAQIPFSQYSQLDSEFEEESTLWVIPAVTSLEAELTDTAWRIKAGMLCQFTACRRQLLEVVEDAYSCCRCVELEMTRLQLPVVLESTRKTITLTAELGAEGQQVVDVSLWTEQPEAERGLQGMQLELNGTLQMLWYDGDSLCHALRRVQQTVELPMAEDCALAASVQPTGMPKGTLGSSGRMQADVLLQLDCMGNNGIAMVSAMTLGEKQPADPNRPSLILQRAGEESLWNIAKAAGSTVEAIQSANGIQEVTPGQILLIPVL